MENKLKKECAPGEHIWETRIDCSICGGQGHYSDPSRGFGGPDTMEVCDCEGAETIETCRTCGKQR